MSAITLGRASNDSLVFGGVPQVHLLPTEIDEQRKAQAFRRKLLIGLGAVVAIAIVATGVASFGLASANSAQALEQERTASLTAEQSKYAAVTSVQGQVSDIQAVQPIAVGGEILWAPYVESVRATLPGDTTITAFKAVMTPTVAAASGTVVNPLDADHVAVLSVTALGPQTSVQAWLAQLPSVKGVVGATPGAVTFSPTTGLYSADVDLQVSKDVIATRFAKGAK